MIKRYNAKIRAELQRLINEPYCQHPLHLCVWRWSGHTGLYAARGTKVEYEDDRT